MWFESFTVIFILNAEKCAYGLWSSGGLMPRSRSSAAFSLMR
jgi:hypothetical protein